MDKIISVIQQLSENMKQLKTIIQPTLLNSGRIDLSVLDKLVFKGEDNLIYRIGSYNNLFGQYYTIQYMESINIQCFQSMEIIYQTPEILITSQNPVDQICPLNLTEEDIKSIIKNNYGLKTLNQLQNLGFNGLGNGNCGYVNDKIKILDWFGGPVLVGNQLVDWKGNILYKIKSDKGEK